MRLLTLPRLAFASLVANIGIVITGGAVRLTGSGLGCPTVPRCTDSSYVPTEAMGVHGAIEFSNRLLTFVLVAVAGLGLLAAYRTGRRRLKLLAWLVLAVIPAQALVGMVTVWTGLNPWVVGCHFLVSVGVIAAAYAFWVATRETDEPVITAVSGALRQLTGVLLGSALATLVLGTVVTGAGPHAGDGNAKRNGLDLETVAQLHADSVFLLIGLTVALWFAARATALRTAASALVIIELAQGVIGFVQYATNLPPLAVGLHMAGACAVWVGALAVWYRTRVRPHRRAGSEAGDQGEQAGTHQGQEGPAVVAGTVV